MPLLTAATSSPWTSWICAVSSEWRPTILNEFYVLPAAVPVLHASAGSDPLALAQSINSFGPLLLCDRCLRPWPPPEQFGHSPHVSGNRPRIAESRETELGLEQPFATLWRGAVQPGKKLYVQLVCFRGTIPGLLSLPRLFGN